jgi:hypothetical protein
MASKWRPLTAAEISKLTSLGCACSEWSKVQVVEGFNPERVKTTNFSGDIRLGLFQKDVRFCGGLIRPAGISNATIHNCQIGNNVYINQVKSHIANYIIEDNSVIENVDFLTVDGQSSFGNGIDIAVINESGGREIPIYDHLSAQLAYVIALYRHRPNAIEKLTAMIAEYTAAVTSSMGIVGTGAKILNSRIIKNVKIGPAATIEAANLLENGTINSCPQDPVYIGPAVSARDFIVCSGAKITEAVSIYRCFIGQSVELGRQYSADNSVFFANCSAFHGEACSVFAGPYTVTHHKSTLLIAGLFSFFNAGSGTNQSNHMYKLGPVHQGIIERGSKTASDSHILWPARVGAFSIVVGRHHQNSDTSELPFSYLIEQQGESILIPAVNLKSVGTIRDTKKWRKRDKRKDLNKLDFINFELLTPYTVAKMLNGCKLLRNLKATGVETNDYFTYHGVKIKHDSLDKGLHLYEIGIDKFLGDCLVRCLMDKQFATAQQLREELKPETDIGPGKWIDLAGLFAPEETVTKFLEDIEGVSIKTLDETAAAFASAHQNYQAYEWAWAINVLQQQIGKTIDAITHKDIVNVINKWKSATIELDNMLLADTQKEFSETAQAGYGIDGNFSERKLDFAAVRGTLESNPVTAEIKQHIVEQSRLADELISRLQKIC